MPTGYIYAIKSKMTNDVYIGSTTQSIHIRFIIHKSTHKKYLLNGLKYMSSYDIMDFGDAYIELLEQIEYNEKIELTNCEGFWIKNTSNCINKHIMGRSHSQYHKDNIEYRSQQQKIRLTCDCGAIYSKSNKSRHEKTPKHLLFIRTEI